jgi:hypothetical protein
MKTTSLRNIVSTARGADVLLPLITGDMTPQQWAQSIAKDTVATKAGREMSAARAALNGAQFAMTNIAMALRCATELGGISFVKASKETQRVYYLLDAMRSAFSGIRQEAHRELTVAEVTLEVKDGVFDGMQCESDTTPYSEEELLDMGMPWEDIQEVLAHQARGVTLSQPMLMETDGSWSESEGEYRTSVHEAKQLWDMALTDIRWSEFSAAPVALIGLNWPTANPMWEPLLDRLADSWQAAIEYADDKEAMTAKVAKREAALEDLHAKPAAARWVINHVTRRVFRDIAALQLKAEETNDRLTYVERQAMNEERYGVPASASRIGTGEQQEYSRKAFLFYVELSEAETARGQEHDTQLDKDRSWHVATLEAIDETITKLRALHKDLRELDLGLAKLWEIYTDGTRPMHPPIYWSRDRFFLQGEEQLALDTIRIEAALAKQKAREAEGDALVKAAALVEAMLGL